MLGRNLRTEGGLTLPGRPSWGQSCGAPSHRAAREQEVRGSSSRSQGPRPGLQARLWFLIHQAPNRGGRWPAPGGTEPAREKTSLASPPRESCKKHLHGDSLFSGPGMFSLSSLYFRAVSLGPWCGGDGEQCPPLLRPARCPLSSCGQSRLVVPCGFSYLTWSAGCVDDRQPPEGAWRGPGGAGHLQLYSLYLAGASRPVWGD